MFNSNKFPFSPNANVSIKNLDAHKVYQLMETGNYDILDIRTPDEYRSGRIIGAMNIDFYSELFFDKISALDRNQAYILYCRTGHRTGESIPLFKELGFKHIIHLYKGIVEWKACDYELIPSIMKS